MKNYGIFDIGSNSIKFSIYQVDSQQQISQISFDEFFLKLYQYIEDDYINQAGINSLMLFFNDVIHKTLKQWPAISFRAFATQYIRKLKNKDELIKQLQILSGQKLQILSGDEEATLNYFAFSYNFPKNQINNLYFLLDVGGGSSEVVIADQKQIYLTHSSSLLGVRTLYKSCYKDVNVLLEKIEKNVSIIHNSITQKMHLIGLDLNLPLTAYGNGGSLVGCLQLDHAINNNLTKKQLQLDNCLKILGEIKNFQTNDFLQFSNFNQKRADVIKIALLILIKIMQKFSFLEINLIKFPICFGYLIWTCL